MKQGLRMANHFLAKRLASYQNLMFFLLLLAVLFAGIASMQSDRIGYQRAYAAWGTSDWDSMPVAVLEIGTAHQTVYSAVSYYFTHSAEGRGGGLLPMRFVMQWLTFILPIVALAASFTSVSEELESGVIQSLFVLPISHRFIGLAKLFGESLALLTTTLLGLGTIALIAARALGISWSGPQLVRALLGLLVVGLYVTVFLLLGSWISAKARRSSKALWVVAAVFLGLFVLHVSIDGVMRMRASSLPELPAVSSDVHLYFAQLQRRPVLSTAEAPGDVVEYLSELSDYSAAVSERIRAQYARERWIGLVSVSHLFLAVEGELLQDEFPSAVGIVFREGGDAAGGSIGASLAAVAPEIAWLILLALALTLANGRALSRLEV